MPVSVVRRGAENSDLCVTNDRVSVITGHGCTFLPTGSCESDRLRYRCPQSAMVSMGLAQGATQAVPAVQQAGGAASKSDWDWWSGVASSIPGFDQAVNSGMREGAVDAGQPGAADAVAPPSWWGRNWPWVMVGGIGVVMVGLVAVTVLGSGGRSTPPPLPPAR